MVFDRGKFEFEGILRGAEALPSQTLLDLRGVKVVFCDFLKNKIVACPKFAAVGTGLVCLIGNPGMHYGQERRVTFEETRLLEQTEDRRFLKNGS